MVSICIPFIDTGPLLQGVGTDALGGLAYLAYYWQKAFVTRSGIRYSGMGKISHTVTDTSYKQQEVGTDAPEMLTYLTPVMTQIISH